MHSRRHIYIKSSLWPTPFSKEELESLSYKTGGPLIIQKIKGGLGSKEGGGVINIIGGGLLTLDMSKLMVNYCYCNKYNFLYFIYVSYR